VRGAAACSRDKAKAKAQPKAAAQPKAQPKAAAQPQPQAERKAKAQPKSEPKAKAKSSAKGTRFVSPDDPVYPTTASLKEYWAEGPKSDDEAEQERLDWLARRRSHPTLDKSGTNGFKRRFKCIACRTIWSGPLAMMTEDEMTEDL
jgi:hypothetical protein